MLWQITYTGYCLLAHDKRIKALAILWTSDSNGNNYQVRSAGRTLRLYTNGVFHSQFNPTRPIGGGLWDLLSLPALFLPCTNHARVLVLGVGGGAVIRQLRVLMVSPHITGIDLDTVHLDVARRWFGVSETSDRLIHADAIDWAASYTGSGFDLVIDDLFIEQDREPVRAIKMDKQWSGVLRRLLKPGGVIVANYLHRNELRAADLTRHCSRNTCFRFEHPLYQNSIGVYTSAPATIAQWRDAIRHHRQLSAEAKRVALNVNVSRVGI